MMIDLTSVGPESQLPLDLEERLQFATLVANLSARFINLPADKVDTQIEEGLREICEYFDLGHSALWQSSTSEPGIKLLSHLRRHPGMPPVPQRVDGDTFFPWVQQKIMRREIVCVPSTANAPPEAVTDKVNWETYGIKSVLALPLWVGDGPILGVLAIGATKEERNWSETVVNRLRSIGQVFANALARQRTEKALNESEARLRLAAASADAGLWTLEPVSGHIWATEKDKELLGFAPTDELDIHRVLNTVHPEDRDTVRRNIDDALMSGEDHSIEYRIVRSDGEIRWISSRGRRHPGEFGHPDNLMGVSTDVTDRKRAEQELRMLDPSRSSLGQ